MRRMNCDILFMKNCKRLSNSLSGATGVVPPPAANSETAIDAIPQAINASGLTLAEPPAKKSRTEFGVVPPPADDSGSVCNEFGQVTPPAANSETGIEIGVVPPAATDNEVLPGVPAADDDAAASFVAPLD